MHRILTTNTFVAKFTDASPLCTLCGNHRETLLHLFATCQQVQCIWESIMDMIKSRLKCNIRLDKKSILLGISMECSLGIEIKNAVQRIILLGKYYIYRTKIAHRTTNVNDWKAFCSFHTSAELYYCNDKPPEAAKNLHWAHEQLCI